jgi:hypothetical protein
MAHPLEYSVFPATDININAGNATPKRADIVGNIILLGDESSPSVTSFLMSRAT